MSQPQSAQGAVVPQLVISRDAMQKLRAYVNAIDTEISGFAYLEEQDGALLVRSAEDVFITAQTVTVGSAETLGSSVAHALYRAMQDGRHDQLRLQWHKHPSGLPTHSRTDMQTIIGYREQGMEWMVSVVLTSQSICARLDTFHPAHMGLEIPVLVFDRAEAGMAETVRSEVSELVTVKKYAPAPKAKRARTRKVVQGAPA
jgi:hypothetical protein